MRLLAEDEEQVDFWRRHTLTGVALCVVLPAVVIVDTTSAPPTSAEAGRLLVIGAVVVVLLAPLLLLDPVARVVRHRAGRLFFDLWEALGVALVTVFALLDGGAASPYVMFFYVLLAHAALSYPPLGMLIAGLGNVAGYLTVVVLGGDAPGGRVLVTVLTLMVATATCAFASHNHVLTYRRTAALARQLQALAGQDGLTGCTNHRVFHDRLRAEAGTAARAHPLALLMVDVDRFKQVNDTFGHPAGDDVLRLVADALRAAARPDDVVARTGGDEFALLMPGATLDTAAAAAERVVREVREAASPWTATVSIGLAGSAHPGDGAGLLERADRAAYEAKRAGRDRLVLAAPPHDAPGQAPRAPTPVTTEY